MQLWQTEGALVGVRDQLFLARLPEQERLAWQQFWTDVAGLLAC